MEVLDLRLATELGTVSVEELTLPGCLIMSTAVAIMLLDDFDRGRCGRGTWALNPGVAVAAADAWATSVAIDPVDWLAGFSYHLGLFDGVIRPDGVVAPVDG